MTEFGIAVPQDVGELESMTLREYLETAESLGFDGLWVSESSGVSAVDPLATLSFAAAVTTRARLGTAVLITNRRTPMQLAGDLASIDRLSAGRLIAGVGIGNGTAEYPSYGLDPAHRAARFEDGIALVKRLWTEDRVTFANRWWTLDDVRVPVRPVRVPHPPIWFGARARPALDRAARLGNGWIGAGSASPESFEESLHTLLPLLDAHGRTADDFTIAKRVYLHVGDETPDVAERVREFFGSHYGNADLAATIPVVGSAARIGEHVEWLESLGVTHIIVHPMVEPAEQMERVARDVVRN
ncbi:LLM class flavin-dependent oxidoreductase [Spelaeicoccus albus]|uniref:Putative F420-dependent oxidoreductase n=1 Tax=Spelaeicoccus albus TaxID=1280376 RepID=A0A7Z0ABP2_9MICO|nr:TIGR03619 family F420-dependent LLM class oxidoreductase [Spelaeicoccus albus]NYI67233.1 putative F420-dependent oxidoreductase [Spelaeicoccus albus]